jgi:Zn-dependent peptidase ImmA (M78 family)
MEPTPPHLRRELWQLTPDHPITLDDGLRLTERYASLLLTLSGINRPAVDLGTLARLLGVEVTVIPDLAISGMAEFVDGQWLILLRGSDHFTRQRFALARELWHVLAEGHIRFRADEHTARRWTQQCREHFAACLLMPAGWVYKAWARGLREPRYLAGHFLVSRIAMTRRLQHLHLTTDQHKAAMLALCAA